MSDMRSAILTRGTSVECQKTDGNDDKSKMEGSPLSRDSDNGIADTLT